MKLLLSAYACEPNRGSEPGVGWGWACEMAKRHQVWVITRDNNQKVIENYLKQNPIYQNDNLKFIYVGLPKALTFWKKGNRGIRFYYTLWQRKAIKVAIKWNNEIHFDLVQHVTFVSYTQLTYMYKLKIPFIWGPVSGGENIPSGFKIKMTLKEWLIEYIRKISQNVALMTPSIKKTMNKAKFIFVTTQETKDKIPQKYHYKTKIMSAIGLENIPNVNLIKRNDNKIKIIMTGRLIYWKAFDIGIKAFLQIVDQYSDIELHILGEGDKKNNLIELSGKYFNEQIFFKNPISHDDIYDFYCGYDIFLNTTLRDSGCMAMMEAMSVGLPCIAIASGGPKILLEKCNNAQIVAQGYNEAICQIATKLVELIRDKDFRSELAKSQKLFICDELLMEIKCNNMEVYYEL